MVAARGRADASKSPKTTHRRHTVGLFDSMKEDISSKLGGEGISSRLFSMFGGNAHEGLRNLVSRFHEKGLGDIASSWVGKGPNKPVSGEQVEQALGSDKLQEIAQTVGASKDQVREQLAKHLPDAVDKATPNGELPKAA